MRRSLERTAVFPVDELDAASVAELRMDFRTEFHLGGIEG